MAYVVANLAVHLLNGDVLRTKKDETIYLEEVVGSARNFEGDEIKTLEDVVEFFEDLSKSWTNVDTVSVVTVDHGVVTVRTESIAYIVTDAKIVED